MPTTLHPLRLALSSALLVVTLSGMPLSAQAPYCECPNNNYCVQAYGRGWKCVPTSASNPICVVQATKTGLCKKFCTVNSDPACPLTYSPLICDDGMVYSNQCYANAACATGCVPYS